MKITDCCGNGVEGRQRKELIAELGFSPRVPHNPQLRPHSDRGPAAHCWAHQHTAAGVPTATQTLTVRVWAVVE